MAVEAVEAAELATWVQTRAGASARFLFGITGPPGCGKSRLAAQLASALGAPIIAMDGFHVPNTMLIERGLTGIKGAPETFAAAEFVDVVRRLREPSSTVLAPIFDRGIDEPIADAVVVAPTDKVVIVEGNYLLLDDPPWSELCALLDAVGYIDVPHDVRTARLIARHVEFGKSVIEAVDFVERSDEPNAALVNHSRTRAGLIVT